MVLVDKRICFVTLLGAFLLSSAFFHTSCHASEKLFSLQIGPTWPSATSSAWNTEFMFGTFVDKKVGFGIAADFLWNTLTQEQRDEQTGQLKTTKDESSYMYPIMGFIVFDPMPYQMIHPMLKFEMGYNSLQYHVDPEVQPDKQGYYYGMIVKLGIDGLYNLGEQAAVFLGLEYQWADTKTTKYSGGIFYRRDMSGTGLTIGFRFLL
jgi:hypothetical protein